ncbi:MAG: CHAT domain-containing protein [Balneolaceae bacterium]|nr:CHAT domain-containing protein [Balneolaceae bacterium]
MILFIFILFQFNPPIDLTNKVSEQIELYTSAITNNENEALNYWALLKLHYSSCKTSSLVKRHVSTSQSINLKRYFSKGTCKNDLFEIELKELVLEISLKEDLPGLVATHSIFAGDSTIISSFLEQLGSNSKSINSQSELLLTKLSTGSKIEVTDIPHSYRSIFLFEIVFNYQEEKYIQEESTLNSELFAQFTKEAQMLSLERSIYDALFAFTLFNEYKYQSLSLLSSASVEDNFFPFTQDRIRFSKATAYASYAIGRYDRSLKIQRNIIQPISEFYEIETELDESKFTEAVNLLSLGKFNDAKIIFEELKNQGDAQVSSAQLFNNLSICYFRLGEKNKYINYLLEAYDEAEAKEDYSVKLTILSNLFFYYTSIGDKNTALEYLDLAEQLAIENNDQYQIARIQAFTGIFYWQTENDASRALKELEIASQVFNPVQDFFDYSRTKKSIAQIYIELDSLNMARESLIELKDASSLNSNTNAYIESLIGLLEIALIRRDLKKAEELFDEIELYSLTELEFKSIVKLNTLTADYLFIKGEQRLAYHKINPVVNQVLERARTTIDTQTGFWRQEREYISAFNVALDIYINSGNYFEALQLLDEIKTINDVALYNSPILRANNLSEEDLAKDRLLNEQIQDIRSKFLNATTSGDQLNLKTQIDQLSAQREEILNKIRSTDQIQSYPIWKVIQSVNNDQQLIHFTEVGDLLYITSVKDQKFDIRTIEFRSAEKALFDNVANKIAMSETDLFDLYQIYQMLEIEDIVDNSKSTLVVIPDNYLYRIPLDILPTKQPANSTSYGSAEYLIENFDIEYFGSLHEYTENSRYNSIAFEVDLSVFAISDFSDFLNSSLPSLPFATQEARKISDALYSFKDKSIFLENEATKENFIDKVSESKIVHIATHSEVSEQDPLFSTIYLISDNDDATSTNALYAYELFDKKLNSELIMLNSCSSGSGEYLQGSGIMGINRALRYAGAKSLALNLWAVNDKVAYEFAGEFYQAINDGKSKAQAMKQAKMYLLESGNANPHYWGAFMLSGNQSPITKKPTNAGLLYPILILIIGYISYYLRRSYTI